MLVILLFTLPWVTPTGLLVHSYHTRHAAKQSYPKHEQIMAKLTFDFKVLQSLSICSPHQPLIDNFSKTFIGRDFIQWFNLPPIFTTSAWSESRLAKWKSDARFINSYFKNQSWIVFIIALCMLLILSIQTFKKRKVFYELSNLS